MRIFPVTVNVFSGHKIVGLTPTQWEAIALDDLLLNGRNSLRPRARIIRILGDELISSDDVAVVELIKNSYDADSSRVLVRFFGTGMEIIDDGHGMELSTIRDTWMEPATLFKKLHNQSTDGRRVLGNKGIGRFASSRLANKLELITRRAGSSTEVVARFDWNAFDDENKYLDQIEIEWFERLPQEICANGAISDLWSFDSELAPIEPELLHGTILRMTELKSTWDIEKVKLLRSKIARLVSPVNTRSISNREFTIRVSHPDQVELDDRVSAEELLSNPPYVLLGNVDATGKYELKIHSRASNRDIHIEGSVVSNDGHRPTCGPFHVDLRVWDRDSKSLNFMVDEETTLKRIRDVLDTASGVSVYRDGFRVLPYGEPHNDWLRLDNRSRQNPTMRLANNQIVGTISITADDNPDLQDQSNREGIIEGRAMQDLRETFKQILNEIEKVRYIDKHPTNKGKKSKKSNNADYRGLFEGLNFDDLKNALLAKYPRDKELLVALEKSEKVLTGRVKQIQEVLSRYRRLSTLGQLVDVVLHEGRHPVAKIKNEAFLAKRDITRGVSTHEKMSSRLTMIENQSEVLSNVFRRVEPFSGRNHGGAGNYAIEELIKDSFSVVHATVETLGIRVMVPDSSTVLRVERTEIQEVMLNLINNSLHWLTHAPKTEREITVVVNRGGNSSVIVLFSDSGPGVSDEDKDYIFDPYFTRKPDGVGLGLTIAGEIITDYYGGNLELIDNGPLKGATFRITLNERV